MYIRAYAFIQTSDTFAQGYMNVYIDTHTFIHTYIAILQQYSNFFALIFSLRFCEDVATSSESTKPQNQLIDSDHQRFFQFSPRIFTFVLVCSYRSPHAICTNVFTSMMSPLSPVPIGPNALAVHYGTQSMCTYVSDRVGWAVGIGTGKIASFRQLNSSLSQSLSLILPGVCATYAAHRFFVAAHTKVQTQMYFVRVLGTVGLVCDCICLRVKYLLLDLQCNLRVPRMRV